MLPVVEMELESNLFWYSADTELHLGGGGSALLFNDGSECLLPVRQKERNE